LVSFFNFFLPGKGSQEHGARSGELGAQHIMKKEMPFPFPVLLYALRSLLSAFFFQVFIVSSDRYAGAFLKLTIQETA